MYTILESAASSVWAWHSTAMKLYKKGNLPQLLIQPKVSTNEPKLGLKLSLLTLTFLVFSEHANENISSDVTLVFDDTHQFSAHKGWNDQTYHESLFASVLRR